MVAILLGTYNGEEFLQEQLDSLFAQTYKDFHLYVRDDGSTDQTIDIIKRYRQIHSNLTIIDVGDKKLGAKANFERLLELADADYYMFCDQDDIWLPNKIEVSLAEIKQLESEFKDIPLLVHTDLQVVDKDLNIINDSFWNYSNINPQIVDKNIYYMGIANSVTGCTIIMNKKAKSASTPFHKGAFMHDAWIALSVMKTGKIDYIAQPTIKYRQHTNNTLGAKEYNKNSILKIKNIYNENRKNYINAHPLVFKNKLHYLYYKLIFFFVIRFRSYH